jgi:hypothetical protein
MHRPLNPARRLIVPEHALRRLDLISRAPAGQKRAGGGRIEKADRQESFNTPPRGRQRGERDYSARDAPHGAIMHLTEQDDRPAL